MKRKANPTKKRHAAASDTGAAVDARVASLSHRAKAVIAALRAAAVGLDPSTREAVSMSDCRAPDAEEVAGYRMPAFRQHGINVHFSAFKRYIGVFLPVSGDVRIAKAIARHAGPKRNLEFPLDESIPYDLIGQIVALRVRQNREKAAVKRKRK